MPYKGVKISCEMKWKHDPNSCFIFYLYFIYLSFLFTVLVVIAINI